MTDQDFGKELESLTIACRLKRQRPGSRKSLNDTQKKKAAEAFHAKSGSLFASKVLFDTTSKTWKECVSFLGAAQAHWISNTTPFPDKGIRLLRRDRMDSFEAAMDGYKTFLSEAAEDLEAEYAKMKKTARDRLGDLFNEDDYPATIADKWGIHWDYVTTEPPEHLKKIAPEIYDREMKRVQQQFDEAVSLTEAAFTDQLNKLVSHLVDRLGTTEDGKPKKFNSTTVDNFNLFFEKFSQMNIGSNGKLTQLVDEAKMLLNDVDGAEAIKKNQNLRDSLKTSFTALREKIDTDLVVDAGRLMDLDDD